MVVSWLDLRFQGILSPVSSQALTLPLIGGQFLCTCCLWFGKLLEFRMRFNNFPNKFYKFHNLGCFCKKWLSNNIVSPCSSRNTLFR